MMDIHQIRHRNVRRLVRQLEAEAGKSGERAGGLTMLAGRLGKSSAQVTHFASENPTKKLGDQIAREIEQAFRLEYGWMDWPHDDLEPAPLSVSRTVRLDPEIVRDVAQALQETYAELGLVYSITAEPELFAEFYERAVDLGSVESRSNLVWLGTRIRRGEARQGEAGEQSKGVGNQGDGAGKARRHRAKG